MKTTDLIPILLYELKDGDKYGLEIVDSIKTASNEKIEIKQPTLYPLLKKLEKSKFISSYWQDSEIGGKRHYYKITQNGLAQLETYPPLEILIENALKDDDNIMSVEKEENTNDTPSNSTSYSPSPFDNLFQSPQNTNDNISIYPTYSSNKADDDIENQLFEQQKDDNLFNEQWHNNDIECDINVFADANIEDESNNLLNAKQDETQSDFTISFEELGNTKTVDCNTPDDKNFNDTNNNLAENNTENSDDVLVDSTKYNVMETTINSNDSTDDVCINSNVFDGLKITDEHLDNSQNIDTDNKVNEVENIAFQSHIDDIKTNSETKQAENSSNSLDIFDALSYADEEHVDKELFSTQINNLNEQSDVNNSTQIENKSNIDTKKQEISNDNLVLNNPFFKESENKSISEKTSLEINQDNAKLIAKNTDSTNFATEKSVKRFTEKTNLPATDFVKDKTKNLFNDYPTHTSPKLNTVATDVEYRDYVDYKTNEKIVKSKKIAKLKLIKILTSSLLTILVLISLLAICIKNKLTPLFVLVFICTTLYIVLYTCKFVGEYKTVRLQIDSIDKQYNFKKQILYRSIIFAVIVVALFVANLVGLKQGKLFGLNNFGNLLAPILLSLMLFVDYLLSYVFYKVLKK